MSKIAAVFVTNGKDFEKIQDTLTSFYLTGLEDDVQMFLACNAKEKIRKKILDFLPKEIELLQIEKEYKTKCAARNEGIKRILKNKKTEIIFFVDENCLVKPHINAFKIYAAAIEQTGIQHFNSSAPHFQPLFRFVLPNAINLSLYSDCLGYFSVYSRSCLQAVGFFEEQFKSESFCHLEYLYRCSKKKFTTPWYWFVDLTYSSNYVQYLEDFDNFLYEKSFVEQDNKLFQKKHGITIPGLPGSDPSSLNLEIIVDIKQIRFILLDFFKKRKIL